MKIKMNKATLCPCCKGTGCPGCYGTGEMTGYERRRIDALRTAYFAVQLFGRRVSTVFQVGAETYATRFRN